MLTGVVEEERNSEISPFRVLAERNAMKLKPHFEDQRCVSELDTSYAEEEKSGRSGFCGYTVGRVVKQK